MPSNMGMPFDQTQLDWGAGHPIWNGINTTTKNLNPKHLGIMTSGIQNLFLN